MTRKVREALNRVEDQLAAYVPGTSSTQFAQFIEDLWLLLTQVKKSDRRKRE